MNVDCKAGKSELVQKRIHINHALYISKGIRMGSSCTTCVLSPQENVSTIQQHFLCLAWPAKYIKYFHTENYHLNPLKYLVMMASYTIILTQRSLNNTHEMGLSKPRKGRLFLKVRSVRSFKNLLDTRYCWARVLKRSGQSKSSPRTEPKVCHGGGGRGGEGTVTFYFMENTRVEIQMPTT